MDDTVAARVYQLYHHIPRGRSVQIAAMTPSRVTIAVMTGDGRGETDACSEPEHREEANARVPTSLYGDTTA